jgi:hypothetical protein
MRLPTQVFQVYGARPSKRVIKIKSKELAKRILGGEFNFDGDIIIIGL